MSLNGIILDLDNTLIDSTRAYTEALEAVGLSLSDPSYQKSRKQVKDRLGVHHVSSHNRMLYFKEWLQNSGHFSPLRVLDFLETYEAALYQSVLRQWNQLGRKIVVEWLTNQYPVVILTNENTRTQMIKMRAIDPEAKYFSRIVTSEEIGCEKPHPRAFEFAANSIGIPLQQCLIVGDSWETDIQPMLSLGGGAIWTQEFTAECKTTSVPTILRFDDLQTYLEKI